MTSSSPGRLQRFQAFDCRRQGRRFVVEHPAEFRHRLQCAAAAQGHYGLAAGHLDDAVRLLNDLPIPLEGDP
jgi:hypothetical protein